VAVKGVKGVFKEGTSNRISLWVLRIRACIKESDAQNCHVTVLTSPVTIHVTSASFVNFYQWIHPIHQKIAAGVRISSRTPFIIKWRKAIKDGIN
jgi:hypothetical protein